MKLGVYFRDIKLGEFFEANNKYVYIANSDNIKRANRKGYLTSFYGFDKSFETNEFPEFIDDYLPLGNNIDLYQLAGVQPSDTKFVALCKLSCLNLAQPDLHFKAENY